jgi:hypothetical protein
LLTFSQKLIEITIDLSGVPFIKPLVESDALANIDIIVSASNFKFV